MQLLCYTLVTHDIYGQHYTVCNSHNHPILQKRVIAWNVLPEKRTKPWNPSTMISDYIRQRNLHGNLSKARKASSKRWQTLSCWESCCVPSHYNSGCTQCTKRRWENCQVDLCGLLSNKVQPLQTACKSRYTQVYDVHTENVWVVCTLYCSVCKWTSRNHSDGSFCVNGKGPLLPS